MPITPADISLYGLDEDLSIYLKKLDAAQAFCQIRRDIDRKATSLKTLTPALFSKHRKADQFRRNVELAVKGDRRGQVLSDLILKSMVIRTDHFLNFFILGCFTLTEATYKKLEDNGLVDNFAEFYLHVIKEFDIYPKLREKLLDIMMDTCKKNTSKTSNVLLGMYHCAQVD